MVLSCNPSLILQVKIGAPSWLVDIDLILYILCILLVSTLLFVLDSSKFVSAPRCLKLSCWIWLQQNWILRVSMGTWISTHDKWDIWYFGLVDRKKLDNENLISWGRTIGSRLTAKLLSFVWIMRYLKVTLDVFWSWVETRPGWLIISIQILQRRISLSGYLFDINGCAVYSKAT